MVGDTNIDEHNPVTLSNTKKNLAIRTSRLSKPLSYSQIIPGWSVLRILYSEMYTHIASCFFLME